MAILDIHDLALARENGADIVGVMAFVQQPLASVLAQPGDPPAARPRGQARRASAVCRPTSPCCARSCRATAATRTRCKTTTIGFQAVKALLAKPRRRGDGVLERRGRRAEGRAAGDAGVPRRRVRRAGLPRARAVRDAPDARRAARRCCGPRSARCGAATTRRRSTRTARSARCSRRTRTSTANAADASSTRSPPPSPPAPTTTASCARTSCRSGRTWDLEFGIVKKPIDVGASFDRGLAQP